MRKNAQRVSDFRDTLVSEINNWLISNPNVSQIEFKRMFTVQIDVASIDGDSDWGTENTVVKYLTNDGFILDINGNEILLSELNCTELAFILDEIESKKYEVFLN